MNVFFVFIIYNFFFLPVPSFSFLYDFEILIPQFFLNVNFPAIVKISGNVQKALLRIYETANTH